MNEEGTVPAHERPVHEIVEPEHREHNPFAGLAVVLVAAFMVLLDISIVNVAIPHMQADLHASYAQIQFVLAGYQLAYGVVLITGGRLGDIFGRKRLFIIGVTGFTLASVLCGFSQDGTQIIAARIVQGLAASLMYPQIFSIILVTFPPQRRGAALGIFGGIVGLATITGPLLGGVLIKLNLLNLDWRPIFLVNVPIGILAVAAANFLLPESRAENAPRLDIPGVLLASTALFLFTFPVVEGRDAGWPTWSFVMIAASAILMIDFAIYERRREARGKDPLVVSHLFSQRAFVFGLLLFLVFFSGLPSMFLTLSLFLQIGLGFEPLHAGLTTIPFALGSGIASGLSIRLVPRFGRPVLSAGALIASLGVLGIILTIRQVGTGLHGPELIPALFVAGVGLGLTIAPSLNFVIAGVKPVDAGSASGVLTTVQQVGGAVGVAFIGVIFFGLLSSNAGTVVKDVDAQMSKDLVTRGVPAEIASQVVAGFDTCFQDRAKEHDPTADPASCKRAREFRPPQPPAPSPGIASSDPAVIQAQRVIARQRALQIVSAVQAVVRSGADRGRSQDFTNSIQGSLLYNSAAFFLSFVLIFLIPAPRRPPGAAPGGGH